MFTLDQDVAFGQKPLAKVELNLLPQILVQGSHRLVRLLVPGFIVEDVEHGIVDCRDQGNGKSLAVVLRQPGHGALYRTLVRI